MNPLDEIARMKQAIESTLTQFLDEVETEMDAEAPGANTSIAKLRWVIRAGGKRIRPIFCLLGNAAAGGGEDGRILRVAASLELLHTFAIVHDDLMDQSRKRRGMRTLVGELDNEGLESPAAMATLIGDLAFVLSETLFSSSGYESQILQKARTHLDRMRMRAVAGQYLDLTLSGKPAEDVDVVRAIARLKTGSYTVEGPLLIGATLAGCDRDLEDALITYGRAIGEAFQLADDLTLLRDPAETGKDPLADLRQGRPLALIAEAYSRSDDRDRVILEEVWGNHSSTENQLEDVRRIVVKTGSEEAMRKVIMDLHQAGVDALRPLSGEKPTHQGTKAIRALMELPALLLAP